jgi:hypothetical protein
VLPSPAAATARGLLTNDGGAGNSQASASASAQAVSSAPAASVENMQVFAHPDLDLVLGKVLIKNTGNQPLPCDNLGFELTPKLDTVEPLMGPLTCGAASVPAGGSLMCGFAAEANAQAYAAAGAAFANVDAAQAQAQAQAQAVASAQNDDEDMWLRPTLLAPPKPFVFQRPLSLFPKFASRFPPPPPKLELCADALAQAFGEDAYGLALSHANEADADVHALAMMVLVAKFSSKGPLQQAPQQHIAAAPQVIEKIVEKPVDRVVYKDKIVEKVIEKPIDRVIYKDKIIEKPVDRVIYKDKIIEKPVERVVYKDKIIEKPVDRVIYKDRVIEKPITVYKDRVVEKPVTVYKDRVVEKPVTVYKDRVIEKVVYREPEHPIVKPAAIVAAPAPEHPVVVKPVPAILLGCKHGHLCGGTTGGAGAVAQASATAVSGGA